MAALALTEDVKARNTTAMNGLENIMRARKTWTGQVRQEKYSLSKLWTAMHLLKDQGMNAVVEREQAEA
jgi:hypothetical protein